MYIKKGLGIASGHTDGYREGKLAAQRAASQCPRADIALLFASSNFSAERVIEGVREVTGDTLVFGSSSYFEITNGGLKKNSVIVLMIYTDAIEFKAYSELCGQAPEEAAKNIVQRFLSENIIHENELISCLLLGTESHLKGKKYLHGINDSFPFPLPISGGGSAGRPDAGFFNGRQYFNDAVTSDNLNMLFIKALDPTQIKFGYAFESSWTPIARPVTCTRTNGNVVFEVDNISIIEYFKTYLGENFIETLNSTMYKYSLIANLGGEEEKFVVKTPGIFNNADGSVSFFPYDDMAGLKIQLVQLGRDELLESARRAALKAKQALDGYNPEAVLVFSCHLRKSILHSRTGEEIAQVREVFGENVPIAGFYCAGEYAPLHNDYRKITDTNEKLCGSQQLSTSISIMVIASKGAEAETRLNYIDLLSEYERMDNSRDETPEGLKTKISELTFMLNDAEQIISETEKAFKYINNEHFLLTLKLQEKNVALMAANERNEKLQDIIKRYTPHNVWKKAGASVDRGLYSILDEELFCALLFIDIKGFTTYSEKHSPGEVINAINKIFDPATTIIYENGGDIDKFIGDAIFAVFPNSESAFKSALLIQRTVKKIIDNQFELRIGINTGRVVSGNVGGIERRDNTLIGGAVNIAQRLESNCEPGAILLSSHSFSQISKELLTGTQISTRHINVKGKEEKIEVFEILPED